MSPTRRSFSLGYFEKHLKACEKCQNTYNELKNDSIDSMIKKEADSVLKQHEKNEKTAAYKAGVIIAGLLLIPILITFIVCLSNGGGLNTFAVVTASMLLVVAMTVIPLMAQQKKLTKCIICGIFALLLIFFFVDRMYSSNEFMLWSVPTIFGLSIVDSTVTESPDVASYIKLGNFVFSASFVEAFEIYLEIIDFTEEPGWFSS